MYLEAEQEKKVKLQGVNLFLNGWSGTLYQSCFELTHHANIRSDASSFYSSQTNQSIFEEWKREIKRL